jgi:hypothetical protein
MSQCEKCSVVCSVCNGTKHVKSPSDYVELEKVYSAVKIATSNTDKAYAEMNAFLKANPDQNGTAKHSLMLQRIIELANYAHKLADSAKILADHSNGY